MTFVLRDEARFVLDVLLLSKCRRSVLLAGLAQSGWRLRPEIPLTLVAFELLGYQSDGRNNSKAD
jgi:hypothetical protein